MNLKIDFSRNYDHDPIHYLGLDNDYGPDTDLYLGSNWMNWAENLTEYRQRVGHKVYYLDLEEPLPHNFTINPYAYYADKLFILCPYTAEYYNQITGKNNVIPVWFPFNPECTPPAVPKEFTVNYFGNRNSTEAGMMVNTVKKFGGVAVSHGNGTHECPTYASKLELIAKSKITIVHNLCWLWAQTAEMLFSRPNYQKNIAYKHLDQCLMPQLKSRTFDAAFCKSFMLVRKDPWNIIERYFRPNIDFMYYDGPDSLEEQINKVLGNYSKYERMIENAYQHAINNYTNKHFIERFLK